jgi:hypothetical protein
MKHLRYTAFFFVLAVWVANAAAPTFGDLAVLVAKGYFRNYVKQDASLEQCVVFLNRNGISFSLFDLIDPDKTVLKEDVARVVGQSMLLFSGEAEVVNGCIKKPLGVETWVDYCLLNDIPLEPVWNGFVKSTADASLPEVRKFFGRSFGRAEKGDIK